MKKAFVCSALLMLSAAFAAAGEFSPLEVVASNKVCMINEQVFDHDQIEVIVDGRKYYGCCEMCRERLAKDESKRSAIDPYSGNTVDKAKAVIGAAKDRSVLYFESLENLRKYNERGK